MVGKLISTHAFWEPFVESQMEEWGLIVNNGQVMMRRTIRSAMKDHRPIVADHLHHPPLSPRYFLFMTAVNETYENWKHFKMRNWGSREFSSGYNKVCRLQWPPPWCGTGFHCWQRCTILFCRCCSWRPAETGPFRGCIQPPRRGINSFESRLGLTCLLSV